MSIRRDLGLHPNLATRLALFGEAQIKLSAVVSDLFGVSGRAMIEALIAGQRNPWALARLARGTLRNKTTILEDALTGHFGDHHGFLCQMMLERIDGLTAQIGQLDARVEQAIAPLPARSPSSMRSPASGRPPPRS
jgi:hypothetical protein